MEILLVVWAVTGLLAVANAAGETNGAECGGTTDKYCDFTKGLYCEKTWKSCAASTGVCTCKTGTVWDGSSTCKTSVDKDGACDADNLCISPYTCDSTCKCPGSKAHDANLPLKCYTDGLKLIGGGTCTADNECESDKCDTVSNPTKCVCPSGQKESGTGCVESSTDGSEANEAVCTNHDACTGTEANCLACGTGTAVTEKKCQTAQATGSSNVGGVDDECGGETGNGCDTTLGLECTIQFEGCKIGQCKCKTGYAWDTTSPAKCEKTTEGDTCTNNHDCFGAMECSTTCKCPTGKTYDEYDSTRCRPDAEKLLGETCANDAGCESGKCTSLVCACPDGKIKTSDAKHCREPKHGETCTTNSNCQETVFANTMECPSNGTKVCSCVNSAYKIISTNPEAGCKASGSKAADAACGAHSECGDNLSCVKCGGTTGADLCRKYVGGSSNSGNMAKLSISTILLIGAYILTL